MTAIENSTWLALKARLQTLSLTPAVTIAWPNESLDPKPASYLRVNWFPNTSRRFFAKGSDPHERPSLLRTDLFTPPNWNVSIALERAGQIAAHFPADLKMTYGDVVARVTKAPDVGSPVNDRTHLLIPISISIEVLA